LKTDVRISNAKGVKRSWIILALLIWSLSNVLAQLSGPSVELFEKLRDFEHKERAKHQSIVSKKRTAALALLASDLKEQSKRGDLDTAIAITEAIKALENENSVQNSKDLPETSTVIIEGFNEFLAEHQVKVETHIAQKKVAVIELLKEQVSQETKKKNIGKALAIRDLVRKLETEMAAVPQSNGKEAKPTTNPESKIPEDAIYHGDAHFKAYLTENPISWKKARKECDEVGGELAWFNSPADEKVIRKILEGVVARTGHAPVWVGGTRNRRGDWEWVNGEMVVSEFWENESDSVSDASNNVMVRWIGSFRPMSPDSNRVVGYICRW